MITLGMTLLCYALALVIPNIGAAISITGATVNPFIGFLFPIIFYLKLDIDEMKYGTRTETYQDRCCRRCNHLFAVIVGILITIISIAGFI